MMKRLSMLLVVGTLSCSMPTVTEIDESLHRGESSRYVPLHISKAGEIKASLLANADTDWLEPGNESTTLKVICSSENEFQDQNVVLFMGRQLFTYDFLLGYLPKGDYDIQFTFDSLKSRPKAQEIFLKSLSVEVITEEHDQYRVFHYSPILYGRSIENTYTDLPLFMYFEKKSTSDQLQELSYTVIYSNEDGGTDTEGLLQNWGRTTDIEWTYSAFLDMDGNFVDATFQGRDHEVMTYTSDFSGKHAILNTCTTNNMVRQDTTSELKFFLCPSFELPSGRTRETAMDRHPYLYEIMVKEMSREGKYENSPNPLTLQASDYRNYLLIDIDFFQNGKGRRNLIPAVCTSSDTTQWYYANHGLLEEEGPHDRSPRRMTIELPSETTLDDLRCLKILDPLLELPHTYLEVIGIQQIAKVDHDFNLQIHPFKFFEPAPRICYENPGELVFDLQTAELIVKGD